MAYEMMRLIRAKSEEFVFDMKSQHLEESGPFITIEVDFACSEIASLNYDIMEATLPVCCQGGPFGCPMLWKTSPTAFSADVAQPYEQYSRRLAERARSLPPAVGRTEAEDVVQSVFDASSRYARGGYRSPLGRAA